MVWRRSNVVPEWGVATARYHQESVGVVPKNWTGSFAPAERKSRAVPGRSPWRQVPGQRPHRASPPATVRTPDWCARRPTPPADRRSRENRVVAGEKDLAQEPDRIAQFVEPRDPERHWGTPQSQPEADHRGDQRPDNGQDPEAPGRHADERRRNQEQEGVVDEDHRHPGIEVAKEQPDHPQDHARPAIPAAAARWARPQAAACPH